MSLSQSNKSPSSNPRQPPPLSFLNSKWGRKYTESIGRTDPAAVPRRPLKKASRSFSKRTLSSHGCTEPHSGDLQSLNSNPGALDPRRKSSSTSLAYDRLSEPSSIYSQSPGGTPAPTLDSRRHGGLYNGAVYDGRLTSIPTETMLKILQERLSNNAVSALDRDDVVSLINHYGSSLTDQNVSIDEMLMPANGPLTSQSRVESKTRRSVNSHDELQPFLPLYTARHDSYVDSGKSTRRALPAEAYPGFRHAMANRIAPTDIHPAFRRNAPSTHAGALANGPSRGESWAPELLFRNPPATIAIGALPPRTSQDEATADSNMHMHTSRTSDGRQIHIVSRKGKEPVSVAKIRGARPERNARQPRVRNHAGLEASPASEQMKEVSTQYPPPSMRRACSSRASSTTSQKSLVAPPWFKARLAEPEMPPPAPLRQIDRHGYNAVPVTVLGIRAVDAREPAVSLPPTDRPGRERRPSRAASIKRGASWVLRGFRQ